MFKLREGQCGLCAHFGEHSATNPDKLVEIRVQGVAPDDVEQVIEPCGLPDHEAHNLMVSPLAGCSGFTPAKS